MSNSLTSKEPEPSEDPRGIYYQYLEELANRDNQNLYQRKLIHHDRDMEIGFEEGTRYLFEEKLGCVLEEMPGSDHADGCVAFPNGELLLWDNKGKESVYQFPNSHLDQFMRYIRESAKRVNVFLVILPSYDPAARLQAMKLKHDTGTDTDVAVISAEDLKWVAESWVRFSSDGSFSLEVFNTTGLLDRVTLEERMRVLLWMGRPCSQAARQPSQTRINRLGLQRQNAEDALMHPVQRLALHEAMEPFETQGVFA